MQAYWYYIIIAAVGVLEAQYVPSTPCVGWDINVCKASCFCGWCYNNTTGVCLSAGKADKCQYTFYTIASSEPCEKLYEQTSIVLVVFLSMLATFAVASALYATYILYNKGMCPCRPSQSV